MLTAKQRPRMTVLVCVRGRGTPGAVAGWVVWLGVRCAKVAATQTQIPIRIFSPKQIKVTRTRHFS